MAYKVHKPTRIPGAKTAPELYEDLMTKLLRSDDPLGYLTSQECYKDLGKPRGITTEMIQLATFYQMVHIRKHLTKT